MRAESELSSFENRRSSSTRGLEKGQEGGQSRSDFPICLGSMKEWYEQIPVMEFGSYPLTYLFTHQRPLHMFLNGCAPEGLLADSHSLSYAAFINGRARN